MNLFWPFMAAGMTFLLIGYFTPTLWQRCLAHIVSSVLNIIAIVLVFI